MQPIEFPLNFERYLALGQEALAEAQFAEAQFNFEKAYNLLPDFAANSGLVESLVNQSKFPEALAVAREMKATYVNGNAGLFKVYVRLLLGNGEFIQSRKLVALKELAAAERRDLLQEIEQRERIFQLYQMQELQALLQPEQLLEQPNFFQQSELLKNWQRLPLKQYRQVVQQVLEKGQLSLLLSNSLLEDLVILGVTGSVESQTLKGTLQRFELKNLPLITTQKSYATTMAALAQQVSAEQEELKRHLAEELRLQLTLLYPLADEIIDEPDFWVRVFLAGYLGEEPRLTTETAKRLEAYQDWQGLLRSALSDIISL